MNLQAILTNHHNEKVDLMAMGLHGVLVSTCKLVNPATASQYFDIRGCEKHDISSY